jgi:long-chain acyl-CoA synthetase
MRLVHEYLIESAQRYPEKTAVICDKKQLSYAEFVQRICRLSTLLVDTGLQKGDRAMILLSDKADFLLAYHAVMKGGGISVPLPVGVSLSSVEQIARQCTPFVLITSRQGLADLPLLRDRLGCKFLVVENVSSAAQHESLGASTRVGTNVILFDANGPSRGDDRDEPIPLGEDDGAAILFTSEDTGRKKGVLLSHRNLVKAALNINEFMRIDQSIREFVGAPLTHSFGLGRSRCVHFVGGTMVVRNGPLNPMALVESVLRNQCNAISAIPSRFGMFFGRLESLLQRVGSQISFIELGSGFMPLDHKLKMLEIFPNANIFMHYGMAEASRSTLLDLRKEERKLHTAGRALRDVSLMIGDDLGKSVGRLEMGEVLVRGEHVAASYWNNVELNVKNYTADGWFKTGDYGFLDDEGYLHVLGRKDEMIDMGDVKVSPMEVEEEIHKLYPGCELWVVGIPDPAGIVGNIPVLCYVANERVTITPSALSRALARCLDQYKIPRVVYRVEGLPKTENKKMIRQELRKRIITGAIYEMERVH